MCKVCAFDTESKTLREIRKTKQIHEQYRNWIDEHRRLPETFRPRLAVSATEHTSGESGKPYFVQSLWFLKLNSSDHQNLPTTLTVMALAATPPLLTDLYVDDDDYDVMALVTSTAKTIAEDWGNTTKKMKCASIGDDVTPRITVVSD